MGLDEYMCKSLLISKKKSKINKRTRKNKANKLKTLVHALRFQILYNSGIPLDVCSFINTML
jgi:hypothetical protein